MTDPDDRRRAVDEITRLGQEMGGYCPNLITGTKGIPFCRLAKASTEALTGIDPAVLADVAWWRAECDGLRTELDRLRQQDRRNLSTMDRAIAMELRLLGLFIEAQRLLQEAPRGRWYHERRWSERRDAFLQKLADR